MQYFYTHCSLQTCNFPFEPINNAIESSATPVFYGKNKNNCILCINVIQCITRSGHCDLLVYLSCRVINLNLPTIFYKKLLPPHGLISFIYPSGLPLEPAFVSVSEFAYLACGSDRPMTLAVRGKRMRMCHCKAGDWTPAGSGAAYASTVFF